jgi:hypothetical protein
MVKPIYIYWVLILIFGCKEKAPIQEESSQKNLYPSTLLNSLEDKGFSIKMMDSFGKKNLAVAFQVINEGTFFNKDFKSELHLKVANLGNQILHDTVLTSGNTYSTIELKDEIIMNENGSYIFKYYVCPDGNDDCEKKMVFIKI